MSIFIVAMNNRGAVVATDSKRGGDDCNLNAQKLLVCHNKLVAFGAGDNFTVQQYLAHMQELKKSYGDSIGPKEIFHIIESFRNLSVETPLFQGIPSLVGACTISQHSPKARFFSIRKTDNYEFGLTPDFDPPVYIAKTKDYAVENAYTFLLETLASPIQQCSVLEILRACVQTIRKVSEENQYVDDIVQYWAYDLESDSPNYGILYPENDLSEPLYQ